MANRIEQRLDILEDALRPGQRIFVRWPDDTYTEAGQLVTSGEIDAAARDGIECIILRVVYED